MINLSKLINEELEVTFEITNRFLGVQGTVNTVNDCIFNDAQVARLPRTWRLVFLDSKHRQRVLNSRLGNVLTVGLTD